MLYAFIADIHGNRVALDAVMKHLDAVRPDRIFNLGDTVGYGAQPLECIGILRERAIPSVIGNHDQAAIGHLETTHFNFEAQASVEWTANMLTPEAKAYLQNLPLTLEDGVFCASHGSLTQPAAFEYILSLQDAAACFDAIEPRIAFIAHSHVPLTFMTDDRDIWVTMARRHELSQEVRAIVNVGSVGQPRDGNPRASYALYDSDAERVEIVRVRYDVDAAAEMIVGTGLPMTNAYRLFLGR